MDDKFAKSIELIDYKNNLKVSEFYNENNLLNKKEVFSLSRKKPDEKFIEEIIYTEEYFYDTENILVEFVTKKNLNEIVMKYSYDKNFKNPDEVVFENEIKKSEKKYLSDFDYTYEIFFDENYSVKSIYKNSIKVEESIYLDGKKIRTSREVDYE